MIGAVIVADVAWVFTGSADGPGNKTLFHDVIRISYALMYRHRWVALQFVSLWRLAYVRSVAIGVAVFLFVVYRVTVRK